MRQSNTEHRTYISSYVKRRVLSTSIPVQANGMPIFFAKSLDKSSFLCKSYLIGVIISGPSFRSICLKVYSLSGCDHRRTYFRVLQNQKMGFAPVHFCMLSTILNEDWIATYLRGDAFVKSIGLDLSQRLTVTKVKELHKRYLDELGEVNALPENE